VTRSVNRIAGRLQRVTDDDVIDFLRRETAPSKRFLGGDHAEIDRADVRETALYSAIGVRAPLTMTISFFMRSS